MDSAPLDSIVVAQLGAGVAGAFCARLFADLGATVIEVQDANLSAPPPSGRTRPTEDDIERLLLGAGKSSVMVDPNEAAEQRLVSDLLAAADVVVQGTEADGRTDVAVRLQAAADGTPDDAVLVEVSDFGSTGPYSGYVGSEIVAGAIGGWLYGVGEPDREPLRPPGRHCRLITGLYAFVGAAAALYRRRGGGPGRYLDVSAMESVLWTQINITTTYDYSGHVPRRHGIRSPMNHPQGLYECADGLIGVNVLYYVEWDRFIELVDRPDLADDPRFATPVLRSQHSEALDEVIRTFVKDRTKQDLYDLAQQRKIPFALVNSPADLLTARQLVGRDFWRTVRDPAIGPVPMPSVPFLIDGARPAPRGPAPQPGQNTADVRQWIGSRPPRRQDPASGAPMSVAASSDQPMLDGLRVVDLTMAWAGPMAVRFLADLGADVVKIEGPQHMDRWRGGTYAQRGTDRYPDHDPGDRPWNRSSFFNTQNRGKRSLALDLKTDGGKQILRDLVARADVVVENFSAGAMGRLGLDYPALNEIKPDIIMVSMPALGRTGPERNYIAHGPTIEELAGTTYLQGYPDGPPLPSGALAWGDPVAGVYGGVALMTALLRKQQTGRGCHIDLSHLEAGVTMNADAVLRYAITGEEPERVGNGDLRWFPQGVFPCKGEDRWIAISITDDACWRRLVEAMGEPGWASDELESVDGRRQQADLVIAELRRWCQEWEHRDLMAHLQSFRVPAGAVLDAGELLADPHLASRGFFVEVDHPETGKHRYPGLPYRLPGSAEPQSRPAPSFAEHNDEILADWLGLSDDETSRLRSAGVLATEPVPQGD